MANHVQECRFSSDNGYNTKPVDAWQCRQNNISLFFETVNICYRADSFFSYKDKRLGGLRNVNGTWSKLFEKRFP